MISIVVPVYKAESYISRCIDSILTQTYSNWELILVDDGSPDLSGAICDRYAELDSRIIVIHKINGGVSAARNTGLQHVSGTWVMFVDADDWISSDCLESCYKEVTENNLDAIQFSHTISFADGKSEFQQKSTTPILSPDQYIERETFNVCIGGGLYNTKIIRDKALEFLTELKLAEDQIFVLNYFMYSKRLKYLDRPMYFYFQNESSAVHNKNSIDLLNAFNSLWELSKTWKPIVPFVNTMCVTYIIDMINSRDVDLLKVVTLYRKLSPSTIMNLSSNSTTLFYKLANFSPLFAVLIFSIYFRLIK